MCLFRKINTASDKEIGKFYFTLGIFAHFVRK